MNALTSLTSTALLGTKRRAPEWPVVAGELGEFLTQLRDDSVERSLLRTAGVLGTSQLAGWLPPRVETAPEPAAEEEIPFEAATALCREIFQDGTPRLQAQLCVALAKFGRRLPHRVLPAALEAARRSAAIRPFVLSVIGQRGVWLAAQNPEWSFATGLVSEAESLDEQWQHGILSQRQAALRQLRETEPARARELLAQALPNEGAKERVALLECLAVGLTGDDESLIESLLTDRGKEVRLCAARLLSSLPDSRFSQRMTQALAACLVGTTKISIEAPEKFVAEWKADLIEETPPKNSGWGARAYWLYQLTRFVPLNWWQSHLRLSPEQLLDWSASTDWAKSLETGWTEAQATQRRSDWAAAFLARASSSKAPPSELLETVSLEVRQHHFHRFLSEASSSRSSLGWMLSGLLQGIPLDSPHVSLDVARSVSSLIKDWLRSEHAYNDSALRGALADWACLIPLPVAAEFSADCNLAELPLSRFAETFAVVDAVARHRRQIEEITPT